MMAARAGNLELVDALLARGADVEQRDEFGHTAWWLALNRAGEDAAFAERALAGLAERLMPAALDVQTAQRLVRLVPTQAEYWVLSVMLAGFKTLGSRVLPRPEPAYSYRLPLHLWSAQRRKRDYVSSVLARAECDSSYRPARQLWVRTTNGHNLPSPRMQLRVRAPEGVETDGDRTVWRPVYDVLNLSWVDAGTGQADDRLPGWTFASVLE